MLTPKQVNFFKPIIDELHKRNHRILCTSRRYREVIQLAKLRGLNITLVGEHGGNSLRGKVVASANRAGKLVDFIEKFNPDTLTSFSSPEAARVAFGLKTRHVGFNDSPHAEAVCRLSIPLMSKLMCPWIIRKKEFTRYGIDINSIISYKALDPLMWLNHPFKKTHLGIELVPEKKTITLRLEESKAAYVSTNTISYKLLSSLIKNFKNCNIVVLSRYYDQIKKLEEYNKHAIILDSVTDGRSLLMETDVFIGSGGTMNCEASLLGVPNISYSMQDIAVNKFLIGKGVSFGSYDINDTIKLARKMLSNTNVHISVAKKARKLLAQMEDPKKKIIEVLERVN